MVRTLRVWGGLGILKTIPAHVYIQVQDTSASEKRLALIHELLYTTVQQLKLRLMNFTHSTTESTPNTRLDDGANV